LLQTSSILYSDWHLRFSGLIIEKVAGFLIPAISLFSIIICFFLRKKEDTMISTEKLYLTRDKKKVVKHGDTSAAFLLCAEGRRIPPQYEHLVNVKEKKTDIDNKELKVEHDKKKKKKVIKFGG